MKKFALVFMFAGLLISCDNDDDVIDDGDFVGESVEYDINSYGDSEIEGEITFTENEDGSITADLDLDNIEEDAVYSADLYTGNSVDGGESAFTFEDVVDGTSSSILEDVSEISSWEELLGYDGHVNVYSSDDDTVIIAQTDIGENELTGESVSYDLEAIDEEEGTAGTAIFEERKNGETLVTLTLEEPSEEGEYPAHIHEGSIEDDGAIAISLNAVAGETGWSQTNLSHFDGEDDEDGEEISYEDLLEYAGYINVHLSADELETIVSQGNIGANIE